MLIPSENARAPKKRASVTPLYPAGKQSSSPVRKAITPSKQTIRAAIPSSKSLRSNDCESALESKFALYAEMSPAVAEWECQPFRVRLEVNSSLATYTPDFKITLKTGEVIIGEVKPLSRCLETETLSKLIAAHHYFNALKWKFVVLTDQDLGSNEYLQNLNLLRYYQRVTVDHAARVSIRKLVNRCGYMSIAELESRGFDKPSIYSLIANHALATDLSICLNPNSPIILPEESDHEDCLLKGRSALDLA